MFDYLKAQKDQLKAEIKAQKAQLKANLKAQKDQLKAQKAQLKEEQKRQNKELDILTRQEFAKKGLIIYPQNTESTCGTFINVGNIINSNITCNDNTVQTLETENGKITQNSKQSKPIGIINHFTTFIEQHFTSSKTSSFSSVFNQKNQPVYGEQINCGGFYSCPNNTIHVIDNVQTIVGVDKLTQWNLGYVNNSIHIISNYPFNGVNGSGILKIGTNRKTQINIVTENLEYFDPNDKYMILILKKNQNNIVFVVLEEGLCVFRTKHDITEISDDHRTFKFENGDELSFDNLKDSQLKVDIKNL